jgi:hypothetical protein
MQELSGGEELGQAMEEEEKETVEETIEAFMARVQRGSKAGYLSQVQEDQCSYEFRSTWDGKNYSVSSWERGKVGCSKCRHIGCPGCRAAVRHWAEQELLNHRPLS